MSVVTPDQRKILQFFADYVPETALHSRRAIAVNVDLSWKRVGVCLRQMEAKDQLREIGGMWAITPSGMMDLKRTVRL